MSNIGFLITGGNGFIGSHTVVELFNYLQNNPSDLNNKSFRIIIIDNYSNSGHDILERIHQTINNPVSRQIIYLYEESIDIQHYNQLDTVFQQQEQQGYPIQYIIHFAGLKAVGESRVKPIHYYQNNVVGSLNLIACMAKYKCNNILFSSSATVYGNADYCHEDNEVLLAIDTYGQTKLTIEYMLRDTQHQFPQHRQFIILRYFNPCGAHPSSLLGETPQSFPNNLFPYVQEVVSGKRSHLNIFGNDFPTADGTGVRDYIHVVDLAQGHISALKAQIKQQLKQFDIFNLGSGQGASVLDVVNTYSQVTGKQVPYQFASRRQGDCASKVAIPNKAKDILGWQTTKNLTDMCQDSYNFITKYNQEKKQE